MKKLLLFLTFLPILTNADPVEIDGVWYNIIPKGNIAEVTYNPSEEKYSGDVIISDRIVVENVEYTVEKIGERAFLSCETLASITIPNTIKKVGSYSFEGCNNLNAVYISDMEAWCNISFESNPLTDAQKLYLNGQEIIDLVIPSTVTSIGSYAFAGYKNLLSVSFSDNLNSIGKGAFSGCKNLTSLEFPNKLTSIGSFAFSGCSNLSSIIIPPSLESIGSGAFNECYALNAVNILDLEAWCKIDFNNMYFQSSNPLLYAHHLYLNGSEIKHLVIPNTITYIPDAAFCGSTEITSLEIPNSVTSIGSYAFYGCESLNKLTIPNSVELIDMGAFLGCSNLETVNIPNSINTIGERAFEGCNKLISLEMSKTVNSIGSYAFSECVSLSKIFLPGSLRKIEEYSFYGCSSLKTVIISEGIETIEKSAFQGCENLEFIDIPEGLTSIDNDAFKDCKKSASLSLPSSMSYIGREAFAGCIALANVYCKAEVLSEYNTYNHHGLYAEKNAFVDSYQDYISLHVPEASIDSYNYYYPWKDFKEIVALVDEGTSISLKCATPEISYTNSKISFSCDTEGVEFICEIKDPDIKIHYDEEIMLIQKYEVSVYATKEGYADSDIAKKTIEIGGPGILGDLNNDGVVDVADHVKLSSIIMNQNE